MKFETLTRLSAVLASFSLLMAPAIGQQALSDGTNPAKRNSVAAVAQSRETISEARPVRDIVLPGSGRLVLTVVQPSGAPCVHQKVSIYLEKTKIAQASTNVQGQVIISGLRPGAHIVRTELTEQLVRFWTHDTAPPKAVKHPAIVDSSSLVRGQYGFGYGYGSPMSTGLLAATLTAIGTGVVVIGKSSSSGSSQPVEPASP